MTLASDLTIWSLHWEGWCTTNNELIPCFQVLVVLSTAAKQVICGTSLEEIVQLTNAIIDNCTAAGTNLATVLQNKVAVLTLQPLSYLIYIFNQLKLCVTTATQNFKWVKSTYLFKLRPR